MGRPCHPRRISREDDLHVDTEVKTVVANRAVRQGFWHYNKIAASLQTIEFMVGRHAE